MVKNAQEWLDKKSLLEEREKIEVIFARSSDLEGELVIENFPKLEKIICDSNSELKSIKITNLPNLAVFNVNKCKINELVIENCPEIISLNVGNNLLNNTDFLDGLNSEKLAYLSIHSNKFEEQNLEFLSKFDNLKELYIDGNESFSGSLEPLVSMRKLKEINISKTNINSGLEYLPPSLEKLYCNNDSIVKELSLSCSIEKSEKGSYYPYQNWRKLNLSEVLSKLRKNPRCLLDNDYPKKERKEIGELDISEKGLEGKLHLEGFEKLKHLICHNNQLTSINLSNCPKLVSIDCKSNKLNKLIFKDTECKNYEEFKLNLEEFQGSDNSLSDIKNILDHINPESLTYFDISNNIISEDDKSVDISVFNNFSKLKSLSIDNRVKSGSNKGNNFGGSLESLKGLKELFDINISNTNVDIFGENIDINEKNNINFSSDFKNCLPNKLEEIHCETTSAKGENQLKDYYNTEDNFYDIKAWKEGKPRKFKIETLIKIPLLSGGKVRSEVSKINEDYSCDPEEIIYDKIYPTETGFSWKTGDQLPLSWLPLRLCHIYIGESKNEKKEIDQEKEVRQTTWHQLTATCQDLANIQTENLDLTNQKLQVHGRDEKLRRKKQENVSKNSTAITIKKRGEYDDSAKNYAILSYFWGDKANENKEWGIEIDGIDGDEAVSSLGGRKSLIKVVKALKVINKERKEKSKSSESQNATISHLWMDQLCIDQKNSKEKAREILNMRHYYGNSTVTLIAIHAKIGEEIIDKWEKSFKKTDELMYPNKIIESSLPILEKIIGSEWFSRSWTFQEGLLSKQTIFMFDDVLIDGRFMALIWKLRQASVAHYDECKEIKVLCKKKASTPIGWTYYEGKNNENYSIRDKASLGLNEALWAVRRRGRSIPLDGIYSILGLLPYGKKVEVDYEKDPESVLREVMLIAVKNGYGEPFSWHGTGSRTPGLCWIPEIDGVNGSVNVLGVINVVYKPKQLEDRKEGFFEANKGIKVKASEYVITFIEEDSGMYSFDREGIVDGNLWMRKVWIESLTSTSNKEGLIKLTLSGTKEGIKAVGKGRLLIVPSREEWQSDKPFAILVLKVTNNKDNSQGDIYHRIDLLRIEEGVKNLKKLVEEKGAEEKKFVIGLNNQETPQKYQVQIEIPSKK